MASPKFSGVGLIVSLRRIWWCRREDPYLKITGHPRVQLNSVTFAGNIRTISAAGGRMPFARSQVKSIAKLFDKLSQIIGM